MIQQADGNIAFLYEEEPAPRIYYNIVYKNLPIELITDGRYKAKI